MTKIFTVFGATGNQGGSVVKNVLDHPELSKTYKIRAITRDVSKPASIALKEKGCEVVAADLNDRDSVFAAVKGSNIVFGVTDFWQKASAEVEIAQGKAIADACKEAGVERFVWSSLPNVSKETNGELTAVKHFDSKAEVEAYVRSIDLPFSVFMPGLFMSFPFPNFKENDQGVYTWTTPFDPETTKVPLLDPASDTGLFVAAALLDGAASLGKRILGSSGYVTPKEMADIYSKITGRKAGIQQITVDQFKAALPPHIADDLGGNMQLVIQPGYYVGEPADGVDKSIELVAKAGLRKPTSWTDYVTKHSAA